MSRSVYKIYYLTFTIFILIGKYMLFVNYSSFIASKQGAKLEVRGDSDGNTTVPDLAPS